MLVACCMVDRCFCPLPWIFPMTTSYHVRCSRRDRRFAKHHFPSSWVGLEHAAVHEPRESMGRSRGGLDNRDAVCFSARRPHGARLTVRGKQEGGEIREAAEKIMADNSCLLCSVRHRAPNTPSGAGGKPWSRNLCCIAAGVSCSGSASERESAS